jgi:hypothetical protein
MLQADSVQAAAAAGSHVPDRRARHFYDPDNTLGKVVADVLGWQGQLAWDIYLFYAPSARWLDQTPVPVAWMHQLGSPWATPTRRRCDQALVEALHTTMAQLTSETI